jgi:hypothetical protein
MKKKKRYLIGILLTMFLCFSLVVVAYPNEVNVRLDAADRNNGRVSATDWICTGFRFNGTMTQGALKTHSQNAATGGVTLYITHNVSGSPNASIQLTNISFLPTWTDGAFTNFTFSQNYTTQQNGTRY